MSNRVLPRKRRASKPSRNWLLACTHCGKETEGTRRREYCSSACKQAAYRLRKAAAKEQSETTALRAEVTRLRRELQALEELRLYEVERAEQAYAERNQEREWRRWADDRAKFWQKQADELMDDQLLNDTGLSPQTVGALSRRLAAAEEEQLEELLETLEVRQIRHRWEWGGFCHGVHVGAAVALRGGDDEPTESELETSRYMGVTKAAMRTVIRRAVINVRRPGTFHT